MTRHFSVPASAAPRNGHLQHPPAHVNMKTHTYTCHRGCLHRLAVCRCALSSVMRAMRKHSRNRCEYIALCADRPTLRRMCSNSRPAHWRRNLDAVISAAFLMLACCRADLAFVTLEFHSAILPGACIAGESGVRWRSCLKPPPLLSPVLRSWTVQ
jgi:hypothetical protein